MNTVGDIFWTIIEGFAFVIFMASIWAVIETLSSVVG